MDVLDYNRCVDKHSDALLRFVVHQLRDRDDAKDIVQESFLRLWMKLDTVDGLKARSYLFGIAQNLIIDRARRSKKSSRYETWCDDLLTVDQPVVGAKEHVDRAMGRLPARSQHLIQLREIEGRSYQDIAELTGLDLTSVKVYLSRARKAIREFIGDPALVI